MALSTGASNSPPTSAEHCTGVSQSPPTSVEHCTGVSHSPPTSVEHCTGVSQLPPTSVEHCTGVSHSPPTSVEHCTGVSHSPPSSPEHAGSSKRQHCVSDDDSGTDTGDTETASEAEKNQSKARFLKGNQFYKRKKKLRWSGITAKKRAEIRAEKLKIKRSNNGWCNKACVYLEQYMYHQAFSLLVSSSVTAKNAMVACVGKLAHTELQRMTVGNSFKRSGTVTALTRKLSLSAIKEFSWEQIISETQAISPCTVQLLTDLFPGHRKMTRMHGRGKTEEELENFKSTRLGHVISLLLFTYSPYLYNLPQALHGFDLWKQGSSPDAISKLNKLGYCQTHNTIRCNADSLATDDDKVLSN